MLWSAVPQRRDRFRSGQLAGRGVVYRALESEAATKLAGSKRQPAAAGRTPERLRRLTPAHRSFNFRSISTAFWFAGSSFSDIS